MVREVDWIFPHKYRYDFPTLEEKIGDFPLIYFDNAATTLKPRKVIQAIQNYYTHDTANIHRGVHTLSQRATKSYEDARIKVQHFIKAKHFHEIIITKSNTEAINLVANSLSKFYFKPGDEILVTRMEHHSNIIPWMLLESMGVVVKVANLTPDGLVDWNHWESLLSSKTKLVSMVYISNSLGTINPVKEKIAIAHAAGAIVLIDGAQAPLHLAIDVQDLDADFFTLSGHKMLGPTGVGILYGKEKWLDQMPPYQGGGDMIKYVSFEKIIYADLPHKFEAGTPSIASMIGLGAAVDYIQTIGVESMAEYTHLLTTYLINQLSSIKDIKIIGPAANTDRSSNVSFVIDNIHPHDIGTLADDLGIALRVGHHCTNPVMDFFKVPATTRASLCFYNTRDEVDSLVKAMDKIIGIFK